MDTTPSPPEALEKGFYRHFKNDQGTIDHPVNAFVYEVVGTGLHTESDFAYLNSPIVIYRRLYQMCGKYQTGAFFLRSLADWTKMVPNSEGKLVPRFERITDPAVIAELEKIRAEILAQGATI